MKQLDLLAYARATDPGTSHAAAKSLDEKTVGRMESLVAHYIRQSGDRGLICDEIVEESGLPWNTVSPRLRPLCRKEIITSKLNPKTQRPITRKGHSGRQQIVWFYR